MGGGQARQQGQPATHHHMSPGEGHQHGGHSRKWLLYDEKTIATGSYSYDAKNPQTWLQMIRDYVAGRTPEVDPILMWAESQSREIDEGLMAECPAMLDSASIQDMDRQMWAMLGALVKSDNTTQGIFKNVKRHCGLEAWRRIAEPINDDKALLRKDLLGLVTNPKSATTIEGIAGAIEDWDTSMRLFREADGVEPGDEQKKITMIQILPQEVATYVAMHLELPELASYAGIRKFTLKYVKVIQNLKKNKAPTHVVENHPALRRDDEEDSDIDSDRSNELDLTCLDGLDVQKQIEILAFMKKQGDQPPIRRELRDRGARPYRAGTGTGAGREIPPRGRTDITCANCGRKGHAASECRQAKVERKYRPCFNCGGKGHLARDCKEPPKKQPVKIIDEPTPFLGCVTTADSGGFITVRRGPRAQGAELGDFIRGGATAEPRGRNRFRPLAVSDLSTDVQDSVSPQPCGQGEKMGVMAHGETQSDENPDGENVMSTQDFPIISHQSSC